MPDQGGLVGELFVSTPTKNRTCAVRFTQRKRLPVEAEIPLKVGASVGLAGSRLSVSDISKLSDSDMDRFALRGRPAWRVVIRSVGPPKSKVAFFPVDPYPIYLSDGRRAALPSSRGGRIVYAPKSAATMRRVFYSELPEGTVAVLLDRDPKTVKTLKLGANEELKTVVKDIPLDPR